MLCGTGLVAATAGGTVVGLTICFVNAGPVGAGSTIVDGAPLAAGWITVNMSAATPNAVAIATSPTPHQGT